MSRGTILESLNFKKFFFDKLIKWFPNYLKASGKYHVHEIVIPNAEVAIYIISTLGVPLHSTKVVEGDQLWFFNLNNQDMERLDEAVFKYEVDPSMILDA